MGYSINIDTGGTFSDGFFANGEDTRTIKVLTTPHDLTVCLMECVAQGARQFGVSIGEMLSKADVIRYSTTIGTNAIIQRTGPKLGLIVTAGYEQTLYLDDDCAGEKEQIFYFINPDMIRGIREKTGETGEVVLPPTRQEVLKQVQELIDLGARAIVVSLKNSFANPAHEKQIKSWIKEEFPSYYLGTPKVFLAGEISFRSGEALRTNTAILNAYIYNYMARYLYKAEEDLRRTSCATPLLISHANGGAARVAKTNALSTYNSGPVAGLAGANLLRELYGFQNMVTTDMGGTSLDIGVIWNGKYTLELEPSIAKLRTNFPMIKIAAIGAGGGSIAHITPEGTIEVGPESAGSTPGPACFGLGGARPTVTDADLALGYLDPGFFLGGRMTLDKAKAEQAIDQVIARPLGLSIHEAAWQIKAKVDANIAGALAGEMAVDGGALPQGIFAYGGAGPTHCCGYTQRFKGVKIITSPYAAVFSAFGLGGMDVAHKYFFSPMSPVAYNGQEDLRALQDRIGQLRQEAYRDMRGEGFKPEQVTFFLEIFLQERTGGPISREIEQGAVLPPAPLTRREGDAQLLLVSLALNAVAQAPHQAIPVFEPAGEDPAPALKGKRPAYWPQCDGFCQTPVYDRRMLRCGNIITGPALIESADTTCVLPPGRKLTIDKFLCGIIEEVG